MGFYKINCWNHAEEAGNLEKENKIDEIIQDCA